MSFMRTRCEGEVVASALVRSNSPSLNRTYHRSLETEILDNDVLAHDGRSDTETNVEHDLGVDLLIRGGLGHVLNVVGHEADLPLHHDDVCESTRDQ